MKAILALGFAAFMVALAVVVGYRMSNDAMNMLIGVLVGAFAGIPVCVLLIVALTRQQRRAEEEEWDRRGRAVQQPGNTPVVVIQGGSPAQQVRPAPYYPMEIASERKLRIVGDE